MQDKILICDDNIFSLQTMSTMIKMKFGIEAQTAHDGQIAVNTCQQTYYKIILMDINMPIMDGFEAAASIISYHKSKKIDPPCIVALTAHEEKTVRNQCLEKGMNMCVTKPISIEQIKNIFDEQGFRY